MPIINIFQLVTGLPVFLLVSYLLVNEALKAGKNSKLPPGPRGYPVIGNIYDIPNEDKWKVYREWGRKLGT